MTHPNPARRILAAAITAAALACPAAAAADQAVSTTSNNTFSPSSVTIVTGESVTFTNANAGTHDLFFSDATRAATAKSSSWTYTRRFDSVGTFEYFCSLHNGMSGSVTVRAASIAPAPSPSPTPTDTGTAPSSGGETLLPGTGSTTTSLGSEPSGAPGSDGAAAPTAAGTPLAGLKFSAASRTVSVPRSGRARWSFTAPAGASVRVSATSIRKVRLGGRLRTVSVPRKAFRASSTGLVRVSFALGREPMKALRRAGRMTFRFTVVLKGRSTTRKVVLRAR